MNKAEFINKLAVKTTYTKNTCEEILTHFGDIISEELALGGEITIPKVGKLKVKATNARQGHHPRTGEVISIPAGRKVVFSTAKEMKEKL